jgi:hypothetical protein
MPAVATIFSAPLVRPATVAGPLPPAFVVDVVVGVLKTGVVKVGVAMVGVTKTGGVMLGVVKAGGVTTGVVPPPPGVMLY